jgi:hypothetical protein
VRTCKTKKVDDEQVALQGYMCLQTWEHKPNKQAQSVALCCRGACRLKNVAAYCRWRFTDSSLLIRLVAVSVSGGCLGRILYTCMFVHMCSPVCLIASCTPQPAGGSTNTARMLRAHPAAVAAASSTAWVIVLAAWCTAAAAASWAAAAASVASSAISLSQVAGWPHHC